MEVRFVHGYIVFSPLELLNKRHMYFSALGFLYDVKLAKYCVHRPESMWTVVGVFGEHLSLDITTMITKEWFSVL